MNLGWGGNSNGYYSLDMMYSANQGAFINIQPTDINNPRLLLDSYKSYESDGDIAGLQLMVTGDFTITDSYLPKGWELSSSPSVIILYSMDGSSLNGKALFEYEGELKLQSFIAADWFGSDIAATSVLLPT